MAFVLYWAVVGKRCRLAVTEFVFTNKQVHGEAQPLMIDELPATLVFWGR